MKAVTRICNPQLLQMYNEVYRKWMEYYHNAVPGVFYSKTQAREWVIAGLILTACVRPSMIREISVAGESVLEGYKLKLIKDSTLQYVLSMWMRNDPEFYKVTDRQVRNICKKILGVSPSVARLLGLAHIACKYGLEEAAYYYDSSPMYVYQLLKYYWKQCRVCRNQ